MTTNQRPTTARPVEHYQPAHDTASKPQGRYRPAASPRLDMRPLVTALKWLDAFIILAVVSAVAVWHCGLSQLQDLFAGLPTRESIECVGLAVVHASVWVVALHLYRTYDARRLGTGVDEYRGIVEATFVSFSMLLIGSVALRIPALHYLLAGLPLGLFALLCGRWVARSWLTRQRRAGRLVRRVLVVGTPEGISQVADSLKRPTSNGYAVVAACSQVRTNEIEGVPVIGSERNAALMAREINADVVAIAGHTSLVADEIRQIAWGLEETPTEMMLVPSLIDVAGPRIHTTPVNGTQLLLIESPKFSGSKLIAKTVLDKSVTLLGLALIWPIMAAIAIMVRLEDGGPALFRQTRVGINGSTFTMLKFRSMVPNAHLLPGPAPAPEGADPRGQKAGKDVVDPRITRLGAFLRKYSLDELPQLLNVLWGDMSLVGPRPPLPKEVAQYDPVAERRLLVVPGVTGLWQVSGRSDLSWEESIRLDLYYVENWSILGDLMILFRTVKVVLAKDGAY